MFTPMKPTGFGMLNDTILNTPQPQATSTVQRRYTLEGRFHDKGANEEKSQIIVDLSSCDYELKTEDTSSLGLLDDMSSVLTNISTADDEQKLQNYLNTDLELEIARKLLQRCSNLNHFNTDVNKENNANVQNVTDISNFIVENNNHIADAEKKCSISTLSNKLTTTNIKFEPDEISARSSALDKTEAEKQYTLNKSCDGISFSSATAEIMKQFNNEEFLSDSQMAEQLSADEASWKQNCIYAMPSINAEKHELDLSSFSGIIGQLDLSLESCAGRKVSVGQYFKRKGGNIGELGDDQRMRPSLGVTAETPMKTYNLEPLIDSTTMTSENIVSTALLTESEEKEHNPNIVIDMDNILSLSTIANTLQDAHSGTPRRLVDQLLMVRKKKKYSELQHNARKETYTLPSERKSMIATPTANVNKLDENISLINLATRLSLDSRIDNEGIDINIKQQLSRMLSFASSRNTKNTEFFPDTCKEEILKEKTDNKNATFLFNQDADFKHSRECELPLPNDKLNVLPSISCKADIKTEQIYSEMKTQDVQGKDMDEQNISKNKMNSSFLEDANSKMQLNSNKNVVISRNTEQLCNCIVGMTCEADIELLNKGDRWITYSLNLNEIRGDKQSIILNIPQDASLIKPNGIQSTKIGVKIKKMCKPIIAVLNIIISDMVVKSKWCIKHMICFKPEELELDITSNSQKQELDFQYVTENSTNILPLYLQNKNSIDMPIKLSMLHDDPKMFSINGTSSELTNVDKVDNDVYYFVLKPQVKFTIDIKCGGFQSSIPTEFSQRQPSCWKSKLVIQVQCSDNTMLLVKEVPIYAQLGTCEIQVTDTDIPIIVSKQQSLNITNSGNVATTVFAFIIPVEGYSNAIQDCAIEPENIFLQVKEKGSFSITYKPQNSNMKLTDNERCVKVKLVAGKNVYYYPVTIKLNPTGLENENYVRCNTPNNVVSSTSPTSPHSIISNKSEVYDRQSPSSTISSTIAGNVVPIKSTHAALVWNSVKTGKSGIKEFTIRNTSNNKIKIQIDVWDDNKSFKLLRDRQIVSTGMVLTMQRTESKTLSVMFSPYYVGPVNGKITIKHYTFTKDNRESQPYKRISLYGYGGYGNVKVFDTFKDATGKMWLSLGTLFSGAMTLRANIKLQNTGDLCSFAKIKAIPKVISPTMDSSWHINPKELILNPKDTRQVLIEFHPNKEEFAMLQRSDVSHVATLNITYGDEPTRWRIRRLYNKIKESGELMGNEKETFKSIVYPLCKAFPDEEMISGLTVIRDSIQNLNDLCTGVHQYEIMLTVEASADDTMSVLHDTDDESQIYYSLISDNSHMDETSGASFFASQTRKEYEIPEHELREDQFIVTPSTVILNPSVQNEVTVNVLSFFKVAQAFQTCLSDPDYFSVIPSEGMLPSKKCFPLKIRYLQRVKRNMQALLEIYTENEKQDVLIKVNAN